MEVEESKPSDMESKKVLLIGNVDIAFLDAAVVTRAGCQVCSGMLEGIDTAARDSFDLICVVVSGFDNVLTSALAALRRGGNGAKIILLAQMFEEPFAARVVDSFSNGQKLADDYLICPVESQQFCELVSAPDKTEDGYGSEPAVDDSTAAKLQQLEHLATTDELTGLKNRRYIWEFAGQIIDYARQNRGRITLLIFDIDNFKHYNDVYSHSAGDEILRQAAVLLRRCCRTHDIVGRIGGDEFAVIFWDPTLPASSEDERRSAVADHPQEAIFIAKRFRLELNKTELHLLGPEGKGVLTISGGLASFPRDGGSIQRLFERADQALLEAKRSGKNRIYLVGTSPSDISDIK